MARKNILTAMVVGVGLLTLADAGSACCLRKRRCAANSSGPCKMIPSSGPSCPSYVPMPGGVFAGCIGQMKLTCPEACKKLGYGRWYVVHAGCPGGVVSYDACWCKP
jgi:hypothetical protein